MLCRTWCTQFTGFDVGFLIEVSNGCLIYSNLWVMVQNLFWMILLNINPVNHMVLSKGCWRSLAEVLPMHSNNHIVDFSSNHSWILILRVCSVMKTRMMYPVRNRVCYHDNWFPYCMETQSTANYHMMVYNGEWIQPPVRNSYHSKGPPK